ncbi:MAG: hypothetical protein ABIW47_00920 [Ginsengibacter sp.]
MFHLKKRPYHLLLLTAILILIASFFALNKSLDIHLHDTYFIIALPHIFRGTTIMLLVLWMLYLLTQSILFSKILTWSHTILLVLTSISLVAISFYSNYQGLAGTPGQYYDYGNLETILQSGYVSKWIVIIILVMVLGIFMYFTNLVIGIFKMLNRRKSSC